MDDEPFVKKGFDWKKQLTTVTPFSKYLALALFVALPFIGFFLGVKYESVRVMIYDPIIVERVFEKEVVVEKGSTTTPEVKIIIFSGTVREGGQTSCFVDGVCSTMVSEYEVIWAAGDDPEPVVGMNDAVRVGDRVEVFGQVIGENLVTLYGNENYYLKKAKSNLSIEPDQGLEKIERGQLMVYTNDMPACAEEPENVKCFEEIIAFTNNAWEYRNSAGVYDEGMLSEESVSELVVSVSETDLVALDANDTCSGPEGSFSILTFYTELGVIDVDECQISESNSPLFRHVVSDVLEQVFSEVQN